jgi:hypothetical protein
MVVRYVSGTSIGQRGLYLFKRSIRFECRLRRELSLARLAGVPSGSAALISHANFKGSIEGRPFPVGSIGCPSPSVRLKNPRNSSGSQYSRLLLPRGLGAGMSPHATIESNVVSEQDRIPHAISRVISLNGSSVITCIPRFSLARMQRIATGFIRGLRR